MGRPRLTDIQIRNAKPNPHKMYKLFDGDGLYIVVYPTSKKVWRFDYAVGGKRKTLTLGSYPEVGLSDARQKVLEAKKLLSMGKDPSLEKKLERQRQRQTLGEIAKEWLEKMSSGWAPNHVDKVQSRLKNWILPELGSYPVREITPPMILQVAEKALKAGKEETAHRLVQLTGQILRYAALTGRINHDPSQALRRALPSRRHEHFPAPTEPQRVAEILRSIWGYGGSPVVRGCLQMLALTFQRPGEVRHMRWDQIDSEKAEWRFTLSKVGKEHIVPLSRQAMEILDGLKPLTGRGEFVFESLTRRGRPISPEALNRALQTLGYDTRREITAHGFRAIARTLLHEELGYPPEIIEHQLGHRVPDLLGEAYNRTKFLAKRKEMLQRWGDYIDSLRDGRQFQIDNVIPLR